MQKILSLLLALAIVHTLSAQNLRKEYYASGQLKATGAYEKNYKIGNWKEYHLNGQIKSEGSYFYGHRTGEWKEYYDNGQLSSIGQYADMKEYYLRKGRWKFYYRNGQLQAEGDYMVSLESNGHEYPVCTSSKTWKCYKENGQTDSIANTVLNCPDFGKDRMLDICYGVYNTEPLDNDTSFRPFRASLRYQKSMYEMCCADPKKDSREQAYEKVRIMWKYFGPNFRCYNYATSIASGKSFFKFAVDNGFSGAVREAMKFWKIDLNFLDTENGQTLMDFLKERIQYIENSPPVDKGKVFEYQKLYDDLRAKGAKHADEL